MIREKCSNKLIKNVISLCTAKEIEVWEINAVEILNNIKSDKYTLIVPNKDLSLFKKKTPKLYKIYSENKYISKSIKSLIRKKCINIQTNYTWYLQQFIKISALKNMKNEDVFLIWDSDTIPLKKIIFFDKKKYAFYKGSENHKPYFDLIEKIFKIKKKLTFSFIAQCLICKGRWVNTFFAHIKSNYKKSWQKVLINNINFNQNNGFSEYETLGSFFHKNFSKEMKFLKNKWCRNGNSEIGSIKNFSLYREKLAKKYDFVAFEKSDQSTLYRYYYLYCPEFIKLIFRKTKKLTRYYIN
jgi:hypothetical protein